MPPRVGQTESLGSASMPFLCGIQIFNFPPLFPVPQPASSSFRHFGPQPSLSLEKGKTGYLPNIICTGELQMHLNVQDKMINVIGEIVEEYLYYLGWERLIE